MNRNNLGESGDEIARVDRIPCCECGWPVPIRATLQGGTVLLRSHPRGRVYCSPRCRVAAMRARRRRATKAQTEGKIP